MREEKRLLKGFCLGRFFIRRVAHRSAGSGALGLLTGDRPLGPRFPGHGFQLERPLRRRDPDGDKMTHFKGKLHRCNQKFPSLPNGLLCK